MAKVILEGSFESLHGKLSKKSDIVYRRKSPTVRSKRTIQNGPQEVYAISRPRDWKNNPPQGAELEKINRFREACRLTSEQLNNPETRPYWEERFREQLVHSEPITPDDPTSGNRKVYTQLWAYTRATILRQLQQKS